MLALTLIAVLILITIGVSIAFLIGHTAPNPQKSSDITPNVRYRYTRKNFIMTKAESDFFDIICRAVGDNYYVFPQIQLSSLLDHRVKYQNWQYALRSINQKSVDYVVCDKRYRRPLLVIELDDRSHDADDRKQRDANVEYILHEAGMPLLRFRNWRADTETEVAKKIMHSLTI